MSLIALDLFGVRVRLDASWLLLAILMTWSLATEVFPEAHANLAPSSYWMMASSTSVAMAVSIVLHEMGHTLVARAFGVGVRSITLFVFGGVADLQKEPDRPWPELLIALAGPFVSVTLSVLLLGVDRFVAGAAPTEVSGVLQYLATLNFALAAFNMAPAFPLDGGRVLRAVVWIATKDPLRATRVAARSGEIIAWIMMGLGATALLLVGLLQGLWWIVLGYFVYSLARAHRADANAKAAFSGVKVADVMTTDLVTAPADISVADFLNDYLTPHPHGLILIRTDGSFIGAAGLKQVKAVARSEWATTPLREAIIPIEAIPAVGPDTAVEQALQQMQSARVTRLLVRGDGRVLGLLSLSDIMVHLKFRQELAEA